MKTSFRVSLVLCTVLGLSVAAEPPPQLQSRFDPQGPPLWVSADRAKGSSDGLQPELFRDRDLPLLLASTSNQVGSDQLVQRTPVVEADPSPEPSAGVACPMFFAGPDDTGYKPHETLEHLVEESLVIVKGEVAEVSQGFFDGVPASLLTLREPELLKASDEYSFDTVYVRYPFAAFEIGERSFCTADPRYTYRPAPGDRVLVFGYYPPRNIERNVLEPFHFGLVVEPTSGNMQLPAALTHQSSAIREMSDVKELVQRTMVEGG